MGGFKDFLLRMFMVLILVMFSLPIKAEEKNKGILDTSKFCGIWEYEEYGAKQVLKIIKVESGKFRLLRGFRHEGKIMWLEPAIKNADGIYLEPSNGKLKGEFVSSNFYATHGEEFTYKITLDIISDKILLYSVHSSIRGETDNRKATKINDIQTTASPTKSPQVGEKRVTSTNVDGFDIRGIKLGMEKDEVKRACPQMSFNNNVDRFGRDRIDKYYGCAGTGCGMISDWNVYAGITDKPYGSGAFYIHYKKFFGQRVSPATFLSGFKSDLVAKYGKPKYENAGKDESYFACWGGGCNKNLIDLNLHEPDLIYPAVKGGKISTGKYLIVSFSNSRILQEVKMTLFDTEPYSIQVRKQKEDETRRSKERIKF